MKKKDNLLKIKLKKWIMPKYLHQVKKLSNNEDPLNFDSLNNAIDSKQSNKKKNEQDVTLTTKAIAEQFKSKKTITLDNKVDEFIKWYTDNMIKGVYINIGKYYFPIEMRNFIEKIAVWYELRYPDYEVNRIMHCSGQEPTQISDEMFNKNNYINQQLDLDSETRILDWDKFYNTKAFIHSLPSNERYYFMKPKYKDIVYWNYGNSNAHLHLSKNGTVEISEDMNTVIPGISNKDFEGKNIKEVVEILKTKGIKIPENNEFIKAIQNYDNWTYQKEEMLNCVMYRIIERGGNRIGPRRAFLFAKEFGRNIDIPMVYGIDYFDPGLRLFINEYIKSGGSKELVCYVNYFSRTSKYEKLNTTTISELIKTQWNNAATKYTPEENILYQKLVNVLSNQVNQEIISKEKVKILRLEKANQTKK